MQALAAWIGADTRRYLGLWDPPIACINRPISKSICCSPGSAFQSFAATSVRFHQPPPNAWNRAAVSENRAATAWTSAMRACS
jgi:hypothetical protein